MTIALLILGWAGCVFFYFAWRGACISRAKSIKQCDEALQYSEKALEGWRISIRRREQLVKECMDFFKGNWRKPRDPADWWKE